MTSQNEDSGTTKTSVVASIPKKEEESDWDNLYDDSGESILSKLSKLNLTNKISGEQEKSSSQDVAVVQASKIDYLKWEPKKPDESSNGELLNNHESSEEAEIIDEYLNSEYAHIIEIYDFPVTFKNENIMNAFMDSIGNDNFSLKWVDDTHCLGIFPNAAEASKALKLDNAFVKSRTISESSEASKQMAKRKLEYLKPYKPRPQTSSLVANRLIGASLGLRNMLPKEKIDLEKSKLKIAKEKNRKEKDLKESVWNGETA